MGFVEDYDDYLEISFVFQNRMSGDVMQFKNNKKSYNYYLFISWVAQNKRQNGEQDEMSNVLRVFVKHIRLKLYLSFSLFILMFGSLFIMLFGSLSLYLSWNVCQRTRYYTLWLSLFDFKLYNI